MTSDGDKRPLRALVITCLGPVPARVLWAWLQAGHCVTKVWTGGIPQAGRWWRDRQLGLLAPHWSLAAVLRRWRIPHRAVESLKIDPAAIADRISSRSVALPRRLRRMRRSVGHPNGWDSLGHIAIVMALDAKIGRLLRPDEIGTLRSLADIAVVLHSAQLNDGAGRGNVKSLTASIYGRRVGGDSNGSAG